MSNTETNNSHAVKLKRQYRLKYGLRQLNKEICVCILIGSRRCMGRKITQCNPPQRANDHLSAFKVIATGELVLVLQPYYGGYPLDKPKDVAELTAECAAFAKEWGLTVRLSEAESWHSPGKTILIEYRKAKP